MSQSIAIPPKITGRHRLATIPDAAAYLACEHKFVRALINRGTLRGYRLPGSRAIRVDLNELDALLDNGRVA